jgi:uncharacterized protein involved in cysteine biosynthesis
MKAVLSALAKAFGQIGDRRVFALLAKTALLTVLVFVVFGGLLYLGLVQAFAASGIAGGGLAEAATAIVIAGISFWFLFRVVALAVLQFFADEIVIAVEQRHYPEAALRAKTLPFRRDLANSLRGIGRTVAVNLLALPVALVLVVTGFGSALVFLLVNAWLLGRELTDMAWLRHCEDQLSQNPVPRGQRLLLGAAVAGIMLVPLANFLAPIIGAAAGTHLAHRAMARQVTEQGERRALDA